MASESVTEMATIQTKRGYQALAMVSGDGDIETARGEVRAALAAAGYVQMPRYEELRRSRYFCGAEVWYQVDRGLKAEVVVSDDRSTVGVELYREPDAAIYAGHEPWDPRRLVRDAAQAQYPASYRARLDWEAGRHPYQREIER